MKEEKKEKNYFEKLNEINVSEKVEKKNGLSYLSWAWAWAEIKKLFPNANYKIYEREDGVNYWTDGKTCWVKTGVTVNEIEHIEYLPVMNFRNQSIALDKVTSFDVNKTIQRSLTKALARHGLGLYIYAGEDLPEGEEQNDKPIGKAPTKKAPTKATTKQIELLKDLISSDEIPAMLEFYKIDKLEDLTVVQASATIKKRSGK